MATSEMRDATVTRLRQAERMSGSEGIDTMQEASEESFPASDAPSWTSVTGIGSPLQEQALRENGRFTLNRGAEGFYWVLTSKDGPVWFWHPEGRQWIANCRAYGSEKEATAGLDDTLDHELAGDLNEQHAPGVGLRSDKAAGKPTC